MAGWMFLAPFVGCSSITDDESVSSEEDGTSVDAAVGEYEDGYAHCCAEGDGTSCCEEYDQGTCFAYGGYIGACVEAGGEFEAKMPCAFCCEGTVMGDWSVETDVVYEGYPAGCGPDLSRPVSLRTCIACGNGVCDPDENRCTCSEDCGAP